MHLLFFWISVPHSLRNSIICVFFFNRNEWGIILGWILFAEELLNILTVSKCEMCGVHLSDVFLLFWGGAAQGRLGQRRIRGTHAGHWQTQASDWNSDVMWSRWRIHQPDHVFPAISSLWRSESVALMLSNLLFNMFKWQIASFWTDAATYK